MYSSTKQIPSAHSLQLLQTKIRKLPYTTPHNELLNIKHSNVALVFKVVVQAGQRRANSSTAPSFHYGNIFNT